MDILRNVPLGLYLESPRTWLHRLDPRVKLVWLMSIVLSPILATNLWRLLLVGFLMVIPWLALLPARVWMRQMGLVLALALMVFGLTAFAPDALGVRPQPQRQDALAPAYGLAAGPDPLLQRDWRDLPPIAGYRYELLSVRILDFGPFRASRRSVSVAIRLATLLFTVFYSASLFLLTTAPEEIAEGLDRLGRPLVGLGVPVAEIILTLTLSIRFLPLVLEEVQNLIRAVRTRDIRWQALQLRGAIQTSMALVERLLENLLLRAEQTAAAMQVRGFVGPSHRVCWHQLRLGWLDRILLALLLPGFWGIRLLLFQSP